MEINAKNLIQNMSHMHENTMDMLFGWHDFVMPHSDFNRRKSTAYEFQRFHFCNFIEWMIFSPSDSIHVIT